jgi:hypothetical protein
VKSMQETDEGDHELLSYCVAELLSMLDKPTIVFEKSHMSHSNWFLHASLVHKTERDVPP